MATHFNTVTKTATIALNAHDQQLDALHKLLSNIVNRAGCGQCGRVALLKVDFAGDPGPEFATLGAVSVHTEGF